MACQNDRARYRNCDPLNQGRAEATDAKPEPRQGEADTTTKENKCTKSRKRRDVQVLCNNNIVQFSSLIAQTVGAG
jgi:hypothetical protein